MKNMRNSFPNSFHIVFYMVSKFGLVGGHGFEPPLCDLTICSPFESPHASLGLNMREDVKKHDTH